MIKVGERLRLTFNGDLAAHFLHLSSAVGQSTAPTKKEAYSASFCVFWITVLSYCLRMFNTFVIYLTL